jgi:hypothetical protein
MRKWALFLLVTSSCQLFSVAQSPFGNYFQDTLKPGHRISGKLDSVDANLANYQHTLPGDFNPFSFNFSFSDLNKLQTNIDFTSIFSSSIDSKIVRINLSGSSFNIKPDTSIIENSVKRIITGSGSFKNYELTVEWKEKHIYTNGRIDTANFKGTLKR